MRSVRAAGELKLNIGGEEVLIHLEHAEAWAQKFLATSGGTSKHRGQVNQIDSSSASDDDVHAKRQLEAMANNEKGIRSMKAAGLFLQKQYLNKSAWDELVYFEDWGFEGMDTSEVVGVGWHP